MIRRKADAEPMCVALFHSTSLAIRGEKLAKEAGLSVKLIPTPRHLSSDCGTALKFRIADIESMKALFDDKCLECDDMIDI